MVDGWLIIPLNSDTNILQLGRGLFQKNQGVNLVMVRLVINQKMCVEYPATQNTLFSIQFNKGEEMISQNIFIEQERWNRYAHPQDQLEDLKLRATPLQTKNYFTNKAITPFMLRQITQSQLHKSQGSIRCSKLKLIYKEKIKKVGIRRGTDQSRCEIEVKSSSKTNVWSEQDQQVSQYLNFWEQEEQLSCKNA